MENLKSYLLNLCNIGEKIPGERLYYSGLRPLFQETDREQRIEDLIKSLSMKEFDENNLTHLDHIAGECAYMNIHHFDYDYLAGRLVSDVIMKSRSNDDPAKFLSEDTLKYYKKFDTSRFYEYNFLYDYMSIRTLQKSYLLPFETPVEMLLRVACGIWSSADESESFIMEQISETFELLLDQKFIHASPTLFQSGLNKNSQLASCFLLQIPDDSLDGIFKTVSDCAKISKSSGGIGFTVSNIRAKGSKIGKSGVSTGIVPMLQVFDRTASYVDQGGKRKGAFCAYIEPWHKDIMEFLGMKNPHANDDIKGNVLFYGLMVPDEFMRRVENDLHWTLFCPKDVNYELEELYGEKFTSRYKEFENDPEIPKVTMKARSIWNKIIRSQLETGTPYIIYKDTCNERSNQKNVGTIKTSNLCAEIVQYVSPDEISTCTLASISLPKHIENGKLNKESLSRTAKRLVYNLNRIIDINEYPLKEAKVSSDRHRPIGIGIQGLADCMAILDIEFESPEAAQFNFEAMEVIYYACLEASCELADRYGPYSTFEGSPFSRGELQFDLAGIDPSRLTLDWKSLKERVKRGTRNSLLTALMPTASTSQILGNTDCFEPFCYLIYKRQALSGDYLVINRHLFHDLYKLDLWNQDLCYQIIAQEGSIQNLDLPDKIKKKYKLVWEMKVKNILNLARDRGFFVDQSQSMSIYVTDNGQHQTSTILTAYLIYGWKIGLKTGIYYTRSRAACSPIKISISETSKTSVKETSVKETESEKKEVTEENMICRIRKDNGIVCESCTA